MITAYTVCPSCTQRNPKDWSGPCKYCGAPLGHTKNTFEKTLPAVPDGLLLYRINLTPTKQRITVVDNNKVIGVFDTADYGYTAYKNLEYVTSSIRNDIISNLARILKWSTDDAAEILNGNIVTVVVDGTLSVLKIIRKK